MLFNLHFTADGFLHRVFTRTCSLVDKLICQPGSHSSWKPDHRSRFHEPCMPLPEIQPEKLGIQGSAFLHPSASEGSAHPCGSVHRSALSFRSSCVFPPYILYTIRKYAIRFYQHNTFWIFWQAYFFCRFTFKPANPCIYWRFR